jgi:hypothetical protein
MKALTKLKAFWGLMQAGKRLANPAPLKMGQFSLEAFQAFGAACVGVWALYADIDVQVAGDQVDAIMVALTSFLAAGFRLFSAVATLITTNKIGIDGIRNPE